jgi:hypothetical protein
MVEALNIRKDADRDEKYLYVNKEVIEFLPEQHGSKIMDIDEGENKALIACLLECKMTFRYFQRIKPRE